MYCRNCGSQMEESAKFCPSCGTSQENKELYTERICPKIEKSLSEVKTQITKGKQSGNLYKIAGWVSVAISLLFIPVLFGAIGVIMGYLSREHDEKHGTILMIAGVAGGILGTLLGLSSGY
ncbi:zinc-ribbon domain-containing protein [Enterococcus faecalis]|uniref:Zinc-ribbon domain-containing protein n=2 Tax=Enterococcus TaxID=1350 RepID=A0A6I4XPW0_ENTGA|nr:MULTISPECIES: zinc-ribbon domain-containing protein [Enterococcus]MXS27909.1 zinc-ribbon domain-containing protein [Enterococcus gallinarum]MXS29933.1 zinc-ribbon domain-containing protein [Enterococcus faecalis]MXS52179.1 zinc-ribbon domain-containing protein [Enterococcus faecalis]